MLIYVTCPQAYWYGVYINFCWNGIEQTARETVEKSDEMMGVLRRLTDFVCNKL